MFGWPMLPSADLPGGGPAYPLSALGVRARAHADRFADRPGRRVQRQPGRQQHRRSAGAKPVGHQLSAERRRAGDRRAAISPIPRSARWSRPTRATARRAPTSSASGTTPKASPISNIDNTGLSLANPASTGIPATHHGDYAFYAVADQMICRFDRTIPTGTSTSSCGRWARRQDRNLIDFSLNAGLTLHEPFLGRDDDTFGIGMGYAKVSSRAAALDEDTGVLQSRRLYAGAQRRDLRGGDLSVSGHAVVAASAGFPIRLQSRRRHRQSRTRRPRRSRTKR